MSYILYPWPSTFAEAKEEAHARANRDGIAWGIWRASMGSYFVVEEFDPGYHLLGILYEAKPNRVPVQVTSDEYKYLKAARDKLTKEKG